MRHLKMLGSALVAGLAVMACVGASSASATVLHFDWCKTSLPAPCPEGSIVRLLALIEEPKEADVFEFKTTEAPTFKGTLNETCEKSETTVESEDEAGTEENSVKGTVTALSFSKCKPCPTANTLPPYSAELVMNGEEYYIKMAMQVSFSGCPLGAQCKFGTTGVKLSLALSGGEAMSSAFDAEEEILTLEEGSKVACGSTAKWTTRYFIKSVNGNGSGNGYFFLL